MQLHTYVFVCGERQREREREGERQGKREYIFNQNLNDGKKYDNFITMK